MLTSYTSFEDENAPVFENLPKTSGTTTKVLSCLKIHLNGMRGCLFASCENIVPRFQTRKLTSKRSKRARYL